MYYLSCMEGKADVYVDFLLFKDISLKKYNYILEESSEIREWEGILEPELCFESQCHIQDYTHLKALGGIKCFNREKYLEILSLHSQLSLISQVGS